MKNIPIPTIVKGTTYIGIEEIKSFVTNVFTITDKIVDIIAAITVFNKQYIYLERIYSFVLTGKEYIK